MAKNKSKYIAIDFDGTCVTHDYPSVGKDIGAIPILKEIVSNGHKLILFTMRDGDTLNDAIKWFNDNGIKLYASQINPSQKFWTKSNKCYANIYIDDAALGCPTLMDETLSDREFVDWVRVKEILKNDNII